MLWDVKKYELIESKQSLHWILTKLLHKDSNTQVSLFNIYAPALYSEKKECWNLLREKRTMRPLNNIILVDDLNVTLSQSEKKGGSLVRDLIKEQVDEIISEWDLSDVIPAKG